MTPPSAEEQARLEELATALRGENPGVTITVDEGVVWFDGANGLEYGVFALALGAVVTVFDFERRVSIITRPTGEKWAPVRLAPNGNVNR